MGTDPVRETCLETIQTMASVRNNIPLAVYVFFF